MYRYHNGTWNPLPTAFVDEDSGAYYFTATSPGFSVFAIGAEMSTEEVTATLTPEAEVTVAVTTPAGAEPTATEQQSPLFWGTAILGAGAAFLLRKQRI